MPEVCYGLTMFFFDKKEENIIKKGIARKYKEFMVVNKKTQAATNNH